MENKRKLVIFSSSMILSVIFWRFVVFFRDGEISILRQITGLNIHHYTYGIVILTIALLFYIFYKENGISLGFLGFGLGSILDGFNSRLFGSETRVQEIANYSSNFGSSLLLVCIVLVFCFILFLVGERYGVSKKVVKRI